MKFCKIYCLILFNSILLSQECIDNDEFSLNSCFNSASSIYSATQTTINLDSFENVRFEWNQCTDGGLYKIYIWDDEDGKPGDDIFSQLILTDHASGWNYDIISTNSIQNNEEIWIGIREYTATQEIGINTDNYGCSMVYNGNEWEILQEGNLGYRLTTCLEDSPAGCFETGCSEGYVCIDDSENNCVPSSCNCDEEIGNWNCTNDCNGGTCFLVGCMDPIACNYDPMALVSDGTCAYSYDCSGICGGDTMEDICGICGGNTVIEEECTQYYCNLELASYLTFGQGLSDITGFYQDGREFAVVGLVEDAATFVDITDPFNPYEVGRISGTPSIWRDLKYWDRHVYIGTEAPDGVKVISVDDPDNPVLVNTITDFTNSHNIHIDADGYLYVVGAADYDVWIYELGDHPSDPTLVGTWVGEYFHDIEVYNNKLYGAAIYSGQFYILDVSDKSNPETITTYYTGGVMTHDCAVTEDEQYLITADETSGGHIKIWDIGDYENINLVSEYITHPDHSVHNVYIRPGTDLAIISYYVDGTRVLDISDPLNPIEVGYFDTSDWTGLYDGNWGTYAYLPSGYIISSDRANGLFIFESPLTNPSMQWNECSMLFGDINYDSYLNILDLVKIVNYILGVSDFSQMQILLSDLNQDTYIDILDLTILAGIILNQ
tara:strand:+ start:295 stop:2283 length:1989 start_codon:yes stop_codon:yes gene_type:complete